MRLNEWAKKEVELLSKKGDMYLTSCASAALEAFELLAEQGHSGYSIGVTKRILNDLIDGKPLTTLTGEDDEWDCILYRNEKRGYTSQQNKRCRALFKIIYDDGRVEYSYNDRYAFYKNDSDIEYHCGYANKYLDEIFGKITMPFYPGPAIKVYAEDFLFEDKNYDYAFEVHGDFDTVGLLYAITPDGTRVELNIFLAETSDGFARISKEEYEYRKNIKTIRNKYLEVTLCQQHQKEK